MTLEVVSYRLLTEIRVTTVTVVDVTLSLCLSTDVVPLLPTNIMCEHILRKRDVNICYYPP